MFKRNRGKYPARRGLKRNRREFTDNDQHDETAILEQELKKIKKEEEVKKFRDNYGVSYNVHIFKKNLGIVEKPDFTNLRVKITKWQVYSKHNTLSLTYITVM